MNAQLYRTLWDNEKENWYEGLRTELPMMSLRDFLLRYGEELRDYYGEDFYSPGESPEYWMNDSEANGPLSIFCLVHQGTKKWLGKPRHTLTQDVRKRFRSAGSARRRKIRHRYSYENPMNRIHGFVILEEKNSPEYPDKKIMAISIICSSSFSSYWGVGSDIMDQVIWAAKKCGYSDIILEVANDHAAMILENNDEEDSESEEDWSEEDSEEESEDSDSEEDEDIWYPTEEVIDIISHELWRKTMRKPEGDNPYYNLGKDYIRQEIESYLFQTGTEEESNEESEESNEESEESEEESIHKKEKNSSISEEPEDNEYGGFWYTKGKRSQEKLMKFYEKFDFAEDPSVFLDWGCFDEIPFPTMRLRLGVP